MCRYWPLWFNGQPGDDGKGGAMENDNEQF